jgi:hypothetical protein
MKRRNGLIVMSFVGLMVVLLCLPGLVIAGGNPPVVGEAFKITGPNLRTTVIMGYRDTGNSGSIDAFLRVDDNLYMVRDTGDDQDFIDLFEPEGAWDIPLGLVWQSDRIPLEIATDYGVSGGDPVIVSVQDVIDYEFQCLDTVGAVLGCQPGPLCPLAGTDGVTCYEPSFGGYNYGSDYIYIVHATVKISFIVPKSGKP